jgi:hypothetical protein
LQKLSNPSALSERQPFAVDPSRYYPEHLKNEIGQNNTNGNDDDEDKGFSPEEKPKPTHYQNKFHQITPTPAPLAADGHIGVDLIQYLNQTEPSFLHHKHDRASLKRLFDQISADDHEFVDSNEEEEFENLFDSQQLTDFAQERVEYGPFGNK